MADLITPPEHPSVAWWAACPWITDRQPTTADGDENENVKVPSCIGDLYSLLWKQVRPGEQWIHTSKWRPPTPQPLTLGQRIDAELAANAELSPELRAILIEANAELSPKLRAILIEAKSVAGEVKS